MLYYSFLETKFKDLHDNTVFGVRPVKLEDFGCDTKRFIRHISSVHAVSEISFL